MAEDKPLVIITGATAVGKSALALMLAQKFNAEIISADSRQVYTGMDIATAKATPEELALVPHHLIDVVRPDEPFSLADFQDLATKAIDAIHARHCLPMLVGGTMLYINAIAEGWSLPRVAPNFELRQQLEARAESEGVEKLYTELTALDPAAAGHIVPNNVRRIIRALEVYYTTGQLFSESHGKQPPDYRVLKLGLHLEREKLYQRADARIEKMFEAGLIEEVQNLLAQGYQPDLPSMSGVGYGQVTAYLRGEMTLEAAKERMRFVTHRYIRQQYTWLRRDPEIIWLEADSPDLETSATELLNQFCNYSGKFRKS
jgi:tRNA dimethylallyltransferase